MKPVNDKNKHIYTALFLIVLTAGIFLRVYQHFFTGRPLWEDEAHLALNFIDSGYLEMFMPLKHFQSAPILFLLSVETSSLFFGFSEIALRSFPFVVSLLTYPLFYYMVRDMTASRRTALIAFILLTSNLYVIQYSSELKPYIVELSAYILLGFLFFSKSNYVASHRDKLLMIAGCILLFTANTSFVILATIVLSRIYSSLQVKKIQPTTIHSEQKVADKKLYKVWAIAFVGMVVLNIIINPYADNMRKEWQSTFIPVNILSADFLHFMQASISQLFYSSVFVFPQGGVMTYLPALLLLAGLVYMLHSKQYIWAIFCIAPIAAHCFLSWAQLYPLYPRFVLYLVPALIAWLAIGIDAVTTITAKKTHAVVAAALAVLLVTVLIQPSTENYPIKTANIKPCLDYINKQPQDMKLFTTTPKTLYEYYHHTGYAKNATREEVKWFITPAQYFDSVRTQRSNYMLLHSRYNYDGYEPIVNALDSMGLILHRVEYSDYRVIMVKPMP